MIRVTCYFALTGLVLVVCACSCCTEKHWARETITVAETIIEHRPDSALHLLQSIPTLTILSEEQQMNYRLRLLQAMDKCDLDITADTTIAEVSHYFQQRGDWPKAALAAFYSARVWQVRKDNRQAIKTYLDAATYAGRTNNNKLQGMIHHNIGWIYYEQLSIQKSIRAYKTAIVHYEQAGCVVYPYMVATCQAISNSYIAAKELDSALYYNDRGLKAAHNYCDSTLLSSIYQCRSIIYREKGMLSEAEKYLNKVFQYSPDERYTSQLYITLIKLYKETQQTDLAIAYAEKALQKYDSLPNSENLRAIVYYLLSAIAKEQGDYENAFLYYRHYNTLLIKIYQDVQDRSVVGLQEKYELAMVKNAHQQLEIKNQQKTRILLLFFIALILISFAFYYYYTRKKTALLAVEQQMAQLKVMAANYDDKDKTLKSVLLRSFDIVKKLSLLEATLNYEEKKNGARLLRRLKEIVFDASDGNYWKQFYPAIDNYYNGRLDVLKHRYPSLNEMEFKVACLCLADFKNDEMAVFMNCSESTIRAKKTSIRKKTGMAQGGDLPQYLAQSLQDSC